jgi:hypothetical protein
MKGLDSIPLGILAIVAGWLAIAPIQPEPHLIEKWRWLFQGNLNRPMDIFDLLLHTLPLVVLALKLHRQMKR